MVTLIELLFKRLIGVRGSYFVSIVALILFMFVSGASSSVVRATIMLMLQILANIFYRKSDTNFNICFSAIVLLIISPLTIYDVGFILSFGGTIGIIQFSKILLIKLKRFGAIAETLSVTISAQLVLIPIMMYYFNTFSIISILPNLVVVPISGSITILGFVVFILSKINFTIAKCVGYVLYILSLFTIKVAELFSKIPFANMQTITPNIFEIVLFYLIIFYLSGKFDSILFHENKQYRFIESKPKKKSIKLVALIVVVFVIAELIIYNMPHSYVEVHCIDVGQGDAFYIRANNKNILIDGGGSDTYDVGTNILVPYLLDKRLMNIDAVFISHSDSDHLNGILTVLENFKVSKIIIAKNSLGFEKIYDIAHEKNIDIIEVLKGDSIEIGNIKFNVISPDNMIDNTNVNEYSLVVKMIYGNKSMLFVGDIGADTESKLFNVDADILKVGHHGSKNSSSQKFIHEVSPKLAIIEVGKDNKYGHPNDEVVKLLEKNSKVLTTAKHGEITIKIYKNKIKYNPFID